MPELDHLFMMEKGYDDLVALIESNPRFVFYVFKKDSIDRRTKKSRVMGWTKVRHVKHAGLIKLTKKNGRCICTIDDKSGGNQLTGSWISWIASNAPHLIYGINLRFE